MNDRPTDPWDSVEDCATVTNARSHWRDLMCNLRTGLRLLCFKGDASEEFRGTAESIAVLAVLGLILRFVVAAVLPGFSVVYAISDLPNELFPILVILLTGLVISKLSRQPDLTSQLPVALLSAMLPLQIVVWITYVAVVKLTGDPSGNAWTYASWTLTAIWFGALALCCRRLVSVRRILSLTAGSVVLLLFLIVAEAGSMWGDYENQEALDTKFVTPASEQVLYSQGSRLDDSLRRVMRGRKGVEELYFLGAGLYSSQDVFMKEVQSIGRLFDERFDTIGRSVLLINNSKTLETDPIATSTSIRRSLARIGQQMNRDEDVLFLYLTSHGSQDHELSVDFWPLELTQINPSLLKQMLDESKIKWRVLVVSACYSGGFIEPLKNDTTMIATAADAENKSFGCSDDADYTYFGRAYFDEELQRGFSFVDAFHGAKASIHERESLEGITHSNPQIFVGDAIRTKLENISLRFEHKPPRKSD